jgi:hypothetical protein
MSALSDKEIGVFDVHCLTPNWGNDTNFDESFSCIG